MNKKVLSSLVVVIAATVVLVGVVFNPVASHGQPSIGVVNVEVLATRYVLPPLTEAVEELQQEFDQRSETLTEEEQGQLFAEYQRQINQLELDYRGRVRQAVAQVSQLHGLELVIEAGAVLTGGHDITDDVIAELEKD